MKKKIVFGLFVIAFMLMISGCGTVNNNGQSSGSGKSYTINGVTILLDKDDDRDNIKYKTSSSFIRDYKTTMSTYTIYKDANKDKYDLSNIVLRLDVNADTYNSESKLEREKAIVNRNDSFKNIEESQKEYNGTTWEYFTFDNCNDESNIFKEHLYMTEKMVNNYYTVYKIYFSFADDIEDFEDAFMNSIVFES